MRKLYLALTAVVVAATILVGAAPYRAAAATGDELRPNLQALPASDLQLQTTSDGRTLLRFSTTSRNMGAGPLELQAGELIPPAVGNDWKQKVYQRVYLEGGGYSDYLAGSFEYHAAHGHVHFEGYARYELQPEAAPGASERIGEKVTFCVMDTTRIDTRLPGAPKRPVYSACGYQVQGMSVGWGDTYGYHLAGQEIDVTGLPDGIYVLRISIDPYNRLLETNDTDNESTVRLQLAGGTVTVLDRKTRR